MIKRFRARLFVFAVIASCVWSVSAAQLKPRKVFPKPDRERMTTERFTAHAMLKLVEGSGIRLQGDHLIVDPRRITERLARTGIDRGELPARLALVNGILSRHQVEVTRLFSRGEAELDEYRADGERASGQELGDQNLFYLLTFRKADDAMIDALEQLKGLDVVEQAAPMPKVSNPVDKPPTTPLLTAYQGYHGAAPTGINVNSMSLVAGGLAQNITIADIEYGWTYTHEDLPSPLSVQNNSGLFDFDHGTAVLGELVGIDNAYGIRGIARAASTRLVGHYNGSFSNVAGAIDTASGLLSAGDVILMETQVFCFGSDLCPSEYSLDVFTAIQNATAAGRVVVEAAGNGGNDLDDPAFNGRFDLNQYDSGAIMVGAGSSTVPHNTLSFSNYGSRVTVQGWGENVATSGYGDLFDYNGDPEQEYAQYFNGTSSASPIVTGSVAVIQGVRKARQLPLLTSTQMRTAVNVGGTAQGSGGHIGPLPNVQSAVAAIPVGAPVITATGTSSNVTISWPAVPGISTYELYRKTSAGGAWTLIYNNTTAGYTDTAVSAGQTYLYKANAVDGIGNRSADSNADLATTINYTDPALVAATTLIKAKHIIEVRTAVNAICTFAGAGLCATLPYSGNALNETYVKTQAVYAADFAGAQSTTINLRAAVGASAAVFRETPTVGGTIKVIHMEDLRTGAN